MKLAGLKSIILASASPRRLDLLTQAGVLFEVVVPGVDETPLKEESPQAMVERLAALKASSVAEMRPGALVIGADTTVFIDGKSLGKPGSDDEACEMLGMIQGRTHQVWGGIAVIRAETAPTGEIASLAPISRVWSHVTEVEMRPMSNAEIKEYVATREPLDKAGSYAIQGIGLQYVDSIKGSYSNVVGLNIAALMGVLRELR